MMFEWKKKERATGPSPIYTLEAYGSKITIEKKTNVFKIYASMSGEDEYFAANRTTLRGAKTRGVFILRALVQKSRGVNIRDELDRDPPPSFTIDQSDIKAGAIF